MPNKTLLLFVLSQGRKIEENLSSEKKGSNGVIKDFDKEIMLHVISCQILA